MVFFTIRKGIFFDDKGEYIGYHRFHKLNNTLRYKEKSFNIITDNPSIFITKSFLFKTYYHFYNINNPMPLILNKKVEPLLNSDLYDVMLETKAGEKLNNMHKKSLLGNIGFKEIVIGLAIIGIIVYFVTGGTIT